MEEEGGGEGQSLLSASDPAFNLCKASVKMMLGEMEEAEEHLRNILIADQQHAQSPELTRDALRSLLYLRWKTGRVKDAIHITKNHAL